MQDCWIRHTQEEKGTVKPAKVSKWALLQPCFWHRWKSQISGEKICLFSDHPDQFDPITNYHHSGVAVGGAHIGWAFPGLTVCVFPSFPGKKKNESGATDNSVPSSLSSCSNFLSFFFLQASIHNTNKNGEQTPEGIWKAFWTTHLYCQVIKNQTISDTNKINNGQ